MDNSSSKWQSALKQCFSALLKHALLYAPSHPTGPMTPDGRCVRSGPSDASREFGSTAVWRIFSTLFFFFFQHFPKPTHFRTKISNLELRIQNFLEFFRISDMCAIPDLLLFVVNPRFGNVRTGSKRREQKSMYFFQLAKVTLTATKTLNLLLSFLFSFLVFSSCVRVFNLLFILCDFQCIFINLVLLLFCS